jgi:hypothetical protein
MPILLYPLKQYFFGVRNLRIQIILQKFFGGPGVSCYHFSSAAVIFALSLFFRYGLTLLLRAILGPQFSYLHLPSSYKCVPPLCTSGTFKVQFDLAQPVTL